MSRTQESRGSKSGVRGVAKGNGGGKASKGRKEAGKKQEGKQDEAKPARAGWAQHMTTWRCTLL